MPALIENGGGCRLAAAPEMAASLAKLASGA